MCMGQRIGEVVKINGNEALVRFGKEISRINISLLKNIRVKDKIICSGNVAIERIEDED